MSNIPKEQYAMPQTLRIGCAAAAGVLLVFGLKKVKRPGVLASLFLGTAAYLTWDALTGLDPFSVIQKITAPAK